MRTKQDNWYTASVLWSDKDANVNGDALIAIMGDALETLSKH
jgi:hypothetical protein